MQPIPMKQHLFCLANHTFVIAFTYIIVFSLVTTRRDGGDSSSSVGLIIGGVIGGVIGGIIVAIIIIVVIIIIYCVHK